MQHDEHTISEQHVRVSKQHRLYVQEWGNPKGHPVVFLHGGPGGQVKDKHKQLFDPKVHRVIFFDQRGCGQSQPYGSLESNTTQDLIADISLLADKFKLGKFTLYGGSWGSCLALAYAVTYPKNVASMVITGVLTGREQEIAWIDQGLFQTFYPDVWQRYLEATPAKYRSNPSEYHFGRILTGNETAQKESAYIYHNLEGGVIALDDRFTPETFEDFDPAGARVEVHYLHNDCFLPDNHIMRNAHKPTMPVIIVQGRYDMVCPPKTAYELHNKLPNSELITTLSGHMSEHEDYQLIRQALRNLAK